MSMEDAYVCEDNLYNGTGLYGIIDGHGGLDVVNYC